MFRLRGRIPTANPLGVGEIRLYTMLQQSLSHILTCNDYLMPYSSHSQLFNTTAIKQTGLEDAPTLPLLAIGLIHLKQPAIRQKCLCITKSNRDGINIHFSPWNKFQLRMHLYWLFVFPCSPIPVQKSVTYLSNLGAVHTVCAGWCQCWSVQMWRGSITSHMDAPWSPTPCSEVSWDVHGDITCNQSAASSSREMVWNGSALGR